MRARLLACLLALAAPAAAAQGTEPDAAQIRELLSLSGTEQQYDEILTIMMDNIRTGFSQSFLEAVREKTLGADKQQKAQAIANRHLQEVLDLYTAEIRKVMPYERLLAEVYVPLYRKYFTAAEIADAIAFFKSPSGRKFAGSAPRLMQDSSTAVMQRYMPLLNRRMNDLMRDRLQKMTEEIGKL